MMIEFDLANDAPLLLKQLKACADLYADGHYTIMRFTTNYRVCFGTPTSRMDIEKMAVGKTLEEAIKICLSEKVDVMERGEK